MRVVHQTPLSHIQFKIVRGQRLIDLHQQLLAVLGRNSDEARMFAIPSVNAGHGVIDWAVAHGGGNATPLTELSAAEREPVMDRLEASLRRVRERAEALRQSADPSVRESAELFDALGRDPQEEDVFVLGQAPLIVNWGCESPSARMGLGVLANRMATRAPAPLTPAGPVPQAPLPVAEAVPQTVVVPHGRSFSWLWPLLLLLLLLFLMSFLLRGCQAVGLNAPFPNLLGGLPRVELGLPDWPSLGFGDPAPPALDPGALDAEAELRAEIAALGDQLAEAANACPVPDPLPPIEPVPAVEPPPPEPAPPEPPPAEPPPDEQAEVEQRLADNQREVGDVNVALIWDNRHDLDLFVEDPFGEMISFEHERSASGGSLDIDMNTPDNRSPTPIENISWVSDPPKGTYRIFVSFYQVAPQDARIDPSPFKVVVSIGGESKVYEGRVSSSLLRQRQHVADFVVE